MPTDHRTSIPRSTFVACAARALMWWRRWGVRVLLAAHVVTLVVLVLMEWTQPGDEGRIIFWAMLGIAQAWLLALWAVLSDRSLVWRVNGFLLGAAMLSLYPLAYVARHLQLQYDMEPFSLSLALAPPGTAIAALAVMLLIRRRSVRFVPITDGDSLRNAVRRPFRIGRLLHLLLGIEGGTLLLSLAPPNLRMANLVLAWVLLSSLLTLTASTAVVVRGTILLRVLSVPVIYFVGFALVILLGPRSAVPLIMMERGYWFLPLLWPLLITLLTIAGLRFCRYRLIADPPLDERTPVRFTLRGGLLTVLVVAMACGIFKLKLDEAETQRRAVAAVAKQGGVVDYERRTALDPEGWIAKWAPLDFTMRIDGVVFAQRIDHVVDLSMLPNLPHVRVLQTRDVQLNDDTLAHLSHHPSLALLSLEGQPITDRGLRHLESIPRLYVLDLQHTQVTSAGVARLNGLSELGTLSLDAACISQESIDSINQITSLRALYITGREMDDEKVALLTKLTNVTSLNLQHTEVSDGGILHLADTRQLLSLDIETTPITYAGLDRLRETRPDLHILPHQVADAPEERETVLALYRQNINVDADAAGYAIGIRAEAFDTEFDDETCRQLSTLSQIRDISISSTDVGDAGLTHLGRLRQLDSLHLNDTKVSDAGLLALYSLSKLTMLELMGTKVTPAGAQKLRRALPNCSVYGP